MDSTRDVRSFVNVSLLLMSICSSCSDRVTYEVNMVI